ncbi:MAG: cytochrome c [Phycisphaerae bacterium]|nr:cytochrome c [Gemmatimonadaceae bacterium]
MMRMVALTVAVAACTTKEVAPNRAESGIGEQSARPATPAGWPQTFGIGSAASDAHIARLDTDVDTTGAGLPAGKGTALEGAPVYAAKCASCHGAKGEGVAPSPLLVQALAPSDSFPWAKKASAPKTVGNYWPFATTLYGYIRHAMPQTAPGSLSPTEVYQLVAYLLAENGVLARDAVLDARTLPAVKLPMRGRLVIDTRRGGAEVR